MGVIVGTRKEKVEIEPKLKEAKADDNNTKFPKDLGVSAKDHKDAYSKMRANMKTNDRETTRKLVGETSKINQVDELKQSTVKSYTDKANKQLKKIGKKMMDDPDDHVGLDDKEKNTLRKRMAGFDMTFRKGVRASQKTTKEGVDDFAVASRSTTRGKVVKTKSGDYIATNQSGSTKSFNDKAKADKHASSGLKKEEVENVDERKLTGAETEKKEKYVMALKKKAGGFKQRYGARAKEVMYATATKMAKKD
jgi:hypothetical protein